MFIDDYIEKISLKKELKNIKEQLKTVQDENAELKTAIDWYHKADMEKRRIILDKNEEIAMLKRANSEKARDLNGTISTLIERVSKSDEENQALKNKVKSLEDGIRHLQWEKDFLAKQVEHLQFCLDLEKNKE